MGDLKHFSDVVCRYTLSRHAVIRRHVKAVQRTDGYINCSSVYIGYHTTQFFTITHIPRASFMHEASRDRRRHLCRELYPVIDFRLSWSVPSRTCAASPSAVRKWGEWVTIYWRLIVNEEGRGGVAAGRARVPARNSVWYQTRVDLWQHT